MGPFSGTDRKGDADSWQRRAGSPQTWPRWSRQWRCAEGSQLYPAGAPLFCPAGVEILGGPEVTTICSDVGAVFGNWPLHRSLLRSSPSGFLLLLQPKPVQQLSLASSPSLPAEPTQLGQFSSQLRQLSQPAKPSQPTFKSVGAGRRHQQALLEQVMSLGQASGSPGPRGVRVRNMHISLLPVGNFKRTSFESTSICI